MGAFLRQYYPKMEATFLLGETYRLRHCPACGLIYQQGVPDGELARALYEDWIDGEASRTKRRRKEHWTRYRRLSEELSLARALLGSRVTSPRVLDFGLGWGEWCKMAAAYGCETFGIELAREKVAQAQAAGIKVLAFADLPEAHFDYINLEQVLEHLAEPWETVSRLAVSLRPGGLMQIAVPNGNGMLARVQSLSWTTTDCGATMPVHALEHLNCFSHAALVKLGERAGLCELRPRLGDAYRYQLTVEDVRSCARSLFRPLVRRYVQQVPKVIFQKPAA